MLRLSQTKAKHLFPIIFYSIELDLDLSWDLYAYKNYFSKQLYNYWNKAVYQKSIHQIEFISKYNCWIIHILITFFSNNTLSEVRVSVWDRVRMILQRAPLKGIMDNGINLIIGSNLSLLTRPKLLFHT